MCRLLGYISDSDTTYSKVVGPHFNQFVELSSQHNDGWGITTKSGIVKEPLQANQSELFEKTVGTVQNDASLMHLRWASKGLAVEEKNNHPFTNGRLSFMHNGSFKPLEALDGLIRPENFAQMEGTTDSERYFLLLSQEIDSQGLEAGIQRTIALIREHASYASLNAMALTSSKFIVISEFNLENKADFLPDDYSDLRYKADEHSFVVASSGWDQTGWTLIPNHTALIVDRATRAIESIAV